MRSCHALGPGLWLAAALSAPAAFGQLTVVNPLPSDQLQTLYHLPEGGAVMPLDFYDALEVVDSVTGRTTGQTFSQRMAGYGFLDDEGNDLPVGFGVVTLDFLNNLKGLSINCSACHVGEIHYSSGAGTTRLRIIGGPNLADVRRFSQDTYYSIRRALFMPRTLLRLLSRSGRLQPQTVAALDLIEDGPFAYRPGGKQGEAVLATVAALTSSHARHEATTTWRSDASSPMSSPSAWPRTLGVRDAGAVPLHAIPMDHEPRLSSHAEPRLMLMARGKIRRVDQVLAPAPPSTSPGVDLVRNVVLLLAEADYFLAQGRFPLSTREGYGRLDAFATVRFLLFPKESTHFPFTAPVSVPHLWGTDRKKWLHWNNNTNSTLQRNIAQALGMGAVAGKGGIHDVLVPNLHPLEQASEQTTSPQWPANVFGPLDSNRVARGETLYDARCARCHDAGQVDPTTGLVEFPLFSLSDARTDPNYALNFHRPVGTKPFPQALAERVTDLQNWYFYRRDPQNPVPQATQMTWEYAPARTPPVWRDPLAGDVTAPVYAGLPLDGIWATAPYLHNNSVPTLRDLLKPASERPKVFRVGHREFDPINVGYVQPQDLSSVDPLELFDTQDAGNSNAGHDGPQFGAEGLTDDDIDDLLEYLKSL